MAKSPGDRELDEAVDVALHAWVAAREGGVSEHPDTDVLVDYQEGALDTEQSERLQHHLEACAECSAELDLLRGFERRRPASPALEPSAQDAERAWQRFREARDARRSGASSQTAPETTAAAPASARSRAAWSLVLAASIALAAVAVLAAVLLRDRPVQTAGSGSPFVFELDPVGTVVLRDVATEREVVVPAGMELLVPRLHLGDLAAHERYLVEVLDSDGDVVVLREHLTREPAGSVTFLVRREEWPAGSYEIRLIALDAGHRQPLASYALRLRYGA